MYIVIGLIFHLFELSMLASIEMVPIQVFNFLNLTLTRQIEQEITLRYSTSMFSCWVGLPAVRTRMSRDIPDSASDLRNQVNFNA